MLMMSWIYLIVFWKLCRKWSCNLSIRHGNCNLSHTYHQYKTQEYENDGLPAACLSESSLLSSTSPLPISITTPAPIPSPPSPHPHPSHPYPYCTLPLCNPLPCFISLQCLTTLCLFTLLTPTQPTPISTQYHIWPSILVTLTAQGPTRLSFG